MKREISTKKKTSVKPKRYLDVRYTLTHTKKKEKMNIHTIGSWYVLLEWFGIADCELS